MNNEISNRDSVLTAHVVGAVIGCLIVLALVTVISRAGNYFASGSEASKVSAVWRDQQINKATNQAAHDVCIPVQPDTGVDAGRAMSDCGAAAVYCGHSIFPFDVAECMYKRLVLPENENDPSVRQVFTTQLYMNGRL